MTVLSADYTSWRQILGDPLRYKIIDIPLNVMGFSVLLPQITSYDLALFLTANGYLP